jgi:YgiT-type zinc finger domain-containing protein
MICTICKTGETEAAMTTMTFERDGSVIVFKDVPCMKCNQCGEIYLEEETSVKLLEELNNVVKYAGEVSIQRFDAA